MVLPGQLHVILGPNWSWKSTLWKICLWHNDFEIISWSIEFKGEDITKLKTYERVKRWFFLTHQQPVAVDWVSGFELLRASQKMLGERKSLYTYKKEVEEVFSKCHLDKEFMERAFNKWASWGEMKKMEMAHLLLTNPDFAFLDEIDSWLDFDAHKVVVAGISEFLLNKSKSVLVVTHSKQILEYLNPDVIHVMCEWRIIKSGWSELVEEVHEKWYAKLLCESKCIACEKKDECL